MPGSRSFNALLHVRATANANSSLCLRDVESVDFYGVFEHLCYDAWLASGLADHSRPFHNLDRETSDT
jgi:hypothetical protein